MTDLRNIYRFLLPLPLVIPGLVYLVSISFENSKFNDIYSIGLITIFSGLIGGIPYLIIATSILIWSRKKSEAQIRKALLLSPLGMVVLFAFAVIAFSTMNIYEAIKGSGFLSLIDVIDGMARFFLAFSVFSLVFGYAYVTLFFGIVRLFRGYSFSKTLK